MTNNSQLVDEEEFLLKQIPPGTIVYHKDKGLCIVLGCQVKTYPGGWKQFYINLLSNTSKINLLEIQVGLFFDRWMIVHRP